MVMSVTDMFPARLTARIARETSVPFSLHSDHLAILPSLSLRNTLSRLNTPVTKLTLGLSAVSAR